MYQVNKYYFIFFFVLLGCDTSNRKNIDQGEIFQIKNQVIPPYTICYNLEQLKHIKLIQKGGHPTKSWTCYDCIGLGYTEIAFFKGITKGFDTIRYKQIREFQDICNSQIQFTDSIIVEIK